MAEVRFVPMERELGTKLMALRGDKSQETVAAALGVRRETIKQWENAERHIKAVDLVKIAQYYDVSVDYLLSLSHISALSTDTQIAQETLGISNAAVSNMLKVSSGAITSVRGMDALLSHKDMNKLMRSVQDVMSKVDYIKKQMADNPTAPNSYKDSLIELIHGKLYIAARTFEAIIEDMVNAELNKPIAATKEATDAEEE